MKLTYREIKAKKDENPDLVINAALDEQFKELDDIIDETRNLYHGRYYSTAPVQNDTALARTPSGNPSMWSKAPQLRLDDYEDQNEPDLRDTSYQATIALRETQTYLASKSSDHANLNLLICTASQVSGIKAIMRVLENARIFDSCLESAMAHRK